MKLSALCHTVASLAMVIPAGAATLTYSGAPMVVTGASGITTITGSLPLFDLSLGTLTSVTFQVDN